MVLSALLALLAFAPGPRTAWAAPLSGIEELKPTKGPAPAVFEDLERWLKRFERERGELPLGYEIELARIVVELERLAAEEAWQRTADCGLLDLLGAGLMRAGEPAQEGQPFAGTRGLADHASTVSERALRRGLGREKVRWLAREVLVLPRVHPDRRRMAAVHLLRERLSRETVLPLILCARQAEGELRRAAFSALSGYADEAVYKLFLDALIEDQRLRNGAELDIEVLESHFQSAGTCPPGRTAGRILRYVKRGLAAGDWRAALRSLAAAPALPDGTAIPVLIDALDVWEQRGADGQRSKRLLYAIAMELERRSGRTIGVKADRWRRWWDAVQKGEIPPSGPAVGDAGYSKATFFGLRPMSDRVTFVIDRSGSMDQPFGPVTQAGGRADHSRYREAVEQMMRFMEASGETARFDIVLFSGRTFAWRSRLSPATPEALRVARSWLLAHRPDGDTLLKMGVERALRLRPNGSVNLERLEADTIIVLCDGETREGPSWVRPLLRRSARARLVFHGVQIGAAGDGTLEQLAAESGGQFVHVEH